MIAQLKKITSFSANGLMATADPPAKTLSPCFLMAVIKDGTYVRELPKGTGFDCNAKTFNTSGVSP